MKKFKRCSNCKDYFRLNKFPLDKGKHDGRSCYCAKCHRELRRGYYKRDKLAGKTKRSNTKNAKRYAKRHPKKVWVHRFTRCAVKLNIIKRQPCLVCFNPKSEAHHWNYDKPLDVIWLCRQHHFILHRKY